jgi:predicted NUDIX family phosphoesterase
MKNNNKVLVVPRAIFFQKGSWQGIKKDNLDYYLELIKSSSFFKERSDVEEDPSYLQIIPYIIFSFEGKFFLYKYIKEAGEKRLIDHYQLAVGGHIDLADGKNLEQAALREWEEEVDFKGLIKDKKLVGILNDDSHMVEKVHLGLIYHFMGDSSNIKVKEADKLKGEMVVKEKIKQYVRDTDIWASIIWRDYISGL